MYKCGKHKTKFKRIPKAKAALNWENVRNL